MENMGLRYGKRKEGQTGQTKGRRKLRTAKSNTVKTRIPGEGRDHFRSTGECNGGRYVSPTGHGRTLCMESIWLSLSRNGFGYRHICCCIYNGKRSTLVAEYTEYFRCRRRHMDCLAGKKVSYRICVGSSYRMWLCDISEAGSGQCLKVR